MDVDGNYQGGGVCDNCTEFTTGINCERCLSGYYRPLGVLPNATEPCLACNCDPMGAIDLECDIEGKCRCRIGYEGDRCERCALGYDGWPRCEACACDDKGTAPNANKCAAETCQCKANVEGRFCDRCKPGYFGLRSDLEEGCLPCYCSGITSLCESAVVIPQKIDSLKEWLVTDLNVSKVAQPNHNAQGVFSLGNYDFHGTKHLYWLAPELYSGNKLHAYASDFTYKVQWVVMRGDTSGEPTIGPNIIIAGKNGLKIAQGYDIYTSSKMTFHIKMTEKGWYFLEEESKLPTAQNSFEIRPVSRQDFLSILTDIKYVLLRSTFHTDQIEALLEEAKWDVGAEEEGYSSVEKCSCPSGYSGLSCEQCSFGYVRVTPPSNSSSPATAQHYCAKCDCNGHSAACDLDTGACACEHNTAGEKCERCSSGYYGNPLRGTVEDCKRCACPLENEENNFSPSCQLDFFNKGDGSDWSYVCTQCPKGYTGDHCEICDDGYYGNPMELGNSCQLCDCNGGPCDRKTGQCLSCKGNTEGWKCEKCKPEHYGDPAQLNCKACECDSIGSVSKQCDNITGQCECKDKFTGRTCDKCKTGYGNITALCPPCTCNSIGSKSEVCNPQTGTCDCRPGIEGFHCDACQNLYFGFSEEGCLPCDCDPDGSQFLTCNTVTGACYCKPHYVGRTCNTCEDGTWKNENKECVKCLCDEHGTEPNLRCNKDTGNCPCKEGVTGRSCDVCAPDYYGTVQTGCKACDPCDKKGHICDPNNGACVCPPLTTGTDCKNCVENSWGFENNMGCKACNCSSTGSKQLQCDRLAGICTCREGYEGDKCDSCSFGYYGYPDCRKCECDLTGAEEEQCRRGSCRCHQDGSCRCKENVEGKLCNKCKDKTYGLTKENPKGCTNCFCFERSDICEEAPLNWDKIRYEKYSEANDEVAEDILMLPEKFLGDLTTSYGGYLTVKVKGGTFTVYLQGNGVQMQTTASKELHLLETSRWHVLKENPHFPRLCKDDMTRGCFMAILQRVTRFTIEAPHRITEVLLDKAKFNISTYPVTHTIEKCECPVEYSGLSCQEPNEGYYKYFPSDPAHHWIDLVVGKSEPCACNGRSNHCNPVTGECTNCRENTTGAHCELCDVGFYMSREGNCEPCLCPTATQNNAESCTPQIDGFVCKCRTGYKGKHCDQCDRGYFNRGESSVTCAACNCNVHGVLDGDTTCDALGKCRCAAGFKGDKCDQCEKARQFIQDGKCTPCDECTQLLFDDIDALTRAINDAFGLFKDGLAPPWKVLETHIGKHDELAEKMEKLRSDAQRIIDDAKMDELEGTVRSFEGRLNEAKRLADSNIDKTGAVIYKAKEVKGAAEVLKDRLLEVIEALNEFGENDVDVNDALNKALKMRDQIQNIASKFNSTRDEEVYQYCSAVSGRVASTFKVIQDVTLPNDLLKSTNKKLNDLINITAFIDARVKETEEKNLENDIRLGKVREKIEKLKSKNADLDSSLKDILEKENATNGTIEQLKVVCDDLRAFKEIPEMKELDEKVKRQKELQNDIEELHLQALDHVEELEQKIDKYRSMFNFTRDEWKKINASGSYESITKGIYKAENDAKMSQDILREAYGIIKPGNTDTLVDRANIAKALSDRLEHRIKNFKDISKKLAQIKNKLGTLKYSILENGKQNNELTQILHKMEDEITSHSDRVSKLEKAVENSTMVSEEMVELEKKLNDVKFDMTFNMKKTLQTYLDMANTDATNELNDKLISTRRTLETLNVPSINFDFLQNFSNTKDKNLKAIQEKIQDLQKKVNYAKQAADVINVPMNLNSCLMSYRLPEPKFFQSLAIIYKCTNCMLFRWKNGSTDVLTVKVKDGKPIVIVEGKTIHLTEQTSENTIRIEKIGSLLKIEGDDGEPRIEKVDKYYIITPGDLIQVGSKDDKADGYILKVLINEQNFGLWKFTNTQGNCKGEKRDPSTKSLLLNFYNGQGYKVYGVDKSLNPKKIALRFYISTFDENSLIYLAKDSACSYIALFLSEGFVHFEVAHNETVSNRLRSDVRYNDGKRYRVEVTMTYENNYQSYDLSVRDETGNKRNTDKKNKMLLPKRLVFKVKTAHQYVGGVPPTFDRSCVIGVQLESFLGILEMSTRLINEIISYGVIHKKNLEFYHAWANEGGYLQLKTSEEKLINLYFILRPIKPNGLVMKLNENKNITLENYRLKVSGIDLLSSVELTENDYNVVHLTLGKHKTLTVNGHKEDVSLLDGITIKDFVVIGDRLDGFVGGIRHILINNKLISFNPTTVMDFSKFDIGREQAPPIREINTKSLVSNFTNSMQNTEGCADFGSYSADPDAIKYGDQPKSFTKLRSTFWKRDYNVTLEFRTFQAEGTILISVGPKQDQYVFLELRKGKPVFHVKRKKRKAMKQFEKKTNDGRWHVIVMEKVKKKLTVTIDKESKIVKLARHNLKDEVYFGGIPDDFSYNKIDGLNPYRGCLRNLVINNEDQFLINNNKDVVHSNIRQCFMNVEEGAYFSGDSYAVYKDDYHINKVFEVSFEFRTAEQNGILLSISKARSSPAISVEMQNGAIVMAVDTGEGAITNVTNNLDSDFALCNNRWHNVTAMYTTWELTINVDGIRKSWVQQDVGTAMDELEAPLYIAGLPDVAPGGTLKTRENFKGCIRNLRINNERIDWTEMKHLNNIMLDSCPADSSESQNGNSETRNFYTVIT
ncbi:unnamed protein product [Callosobruchus maculatus]|nr:unnamed protein product [Callosobruchus maculatus]